MGGKGYRQTIKLGAQRDNSPNALYRKFDGSANNYRRSVAIVEKSREKVSSQEYSQTRFLNSRFLAYQNLMPILNEMGEKEKALAASEFFKGRILWDVIQTGKTNTSEKIKSSSSVLLVGIYFNRKKLKAEACA